MQVDFWEALSETDKVWVRKATAAIGEENVRLGKSEIAIGEQLYIVQPILVPKGLFGRYLRENFRMSTATAYRYIRCYEKARATTRPEVLTVALRHGYTPSEEIVREIPEDAGESEILTHFQNLREMPKRQVVTVESDPRVIVREVQLFAQSRLRKLPESIRQSRAKAMCELILADAGFVQAISLHPERRKVRAA